MNEILKGLKSRIVDVNLVKNKYVIDYSGDENEKADIEMQLEQFIKDERQKIFTKSLKTEEI